MITMFWPLFVYYVFLTLAIVCTVYVLLTLAIVCIYVLLTLAIVCALYVLLTLAIVCVLLLYVFLLLLLLWWCHHYYYYHHPLFIHCSLLLLSGRRSFVEFFYDYSSSVARQDTDTRHETTDPCTRKHRAICTDILQTWQQGEEIAAPQALAPTLKALSRCSNI